jgi:hypothetical protein
MISIPLGRRFRSKGKILKNKCKAISYVIPGLWSFHMTPVGPDRITHMEKTWIKKIKLLLSSNIHGDQI